MTLKKCLVNTRYGRLIVLEELPVPPKVPNRNQPIKCQCDCGIITIKARRNLLEGNTISCGCVLSERAKQHNENWAQHQRREAGHPQDVPILSVNNRLRLKFNREVTYLIKERDNFKCVICLSTETLCVHHIKNWAHSPELRFEPTNLVTLCKKCHFEKAHSSNFSKPPDQKFIKIFEEYVNNLS